MPNIWTHILFIDELCERIPCHPLIHAAPNSLHMGAQGPDPFFYHNFPPFCSSKKGTALGTLLHTSRCGPFLMDMIEAGAKEKAPMQAYMTGFISHHMLDRTTHPFIHFHAGYEGAKHQELEVIIDTLLMKRFRKKDPWKTAVHKHIRLSSTLEEQLTSLMHPLLARHFPSEASHYPRSLIRQSYRHMTAAQKLLRDRWQWKNKWLSSFVSSYSHSPIIDDIDYMNESRRPWQHSATSAVHTESFIDLYEAALSEAVTVLSLVFHYWEHQQTETFKQLKKKIGDISYDTGRPLSENRANQYSRPLL